MVVINIKKIEKIYGKTSSNYLEDLEERTCLVL